MKTFEKWTWLSLEWDNTNPFPHHLLPLQIPPRLCPGEEGLISVCESLGRWYKHSSLGWMWQSCCQSGEGEQEAGKQPLERDLGVLVGSKFSLSQMSPSWTEKLILENKKHKFLFVWPLLHSCAHFKHLEHLRAARPWRCLWYAQHHSQIPCYLPVYRSTGKTSLTRLS